MAGRSRATRCSTPGASARARRARREPTARIEAEEIAARHRVRGCRRAGHRQASRPGHPSRRRATLGHARQRAARRAPARASTAASAGADRPGIVHRLDRDTSGLIVVARNDEAQAALMAQLKARRVKKTYLALVAGATAAEVGSHRGAHRPRPAPVRAHGRAARRPAVGHRLPGARALRAAGRCSRST